MKKVKSKKNQVYSKYLDTYSIAFVNLNYQPY